jgi:chloramphenicol 3-O-phosphotransferase
VALVGPCAAGKSTLAEALRAAGFEVRHLAQEHSFAPEMWARHRPPGEALVYLDADLEAINARRPGDPLRPEELTEQQRRLAHARAHADLYLDTSRLRPAEVRARVLSFLAEPA